jgi:hypothetical protein
VIVAIGMDPGPTPGFVKLTYSEQRLIDVAVIQCSFNQALDVLNMWLRPLHEANRSRSLARSGRNELYFQGEKFVISQGSYRTGSPGARTRELAGSAETLAVTAGCVVSMRDASTAKAWATNARLEAAGVYDATVGMTHARDAARHALYTACKDAQIPDPLSRKAKRRA